MTTLPAVENEAQALRISTLDMPREKWLELRKTGIGSSDAATVAGLNPYETPISLWEVKTGILPDKDLSDDEKVHFGNVLEEVVADEFARRMNRKVRRVNAMLRHPEYPFMIANLDREIVAEDGREPEILECKTVGLLAAMNGEWGDGLDEVPERYIVQVQHQLAVRNRRRAYLAALIGGQSMKIYTIDRDDELIADLIEIEKAFWRCVESNEMPSVTQLADAKRLFPKSAAKEIQATADIATLVLDYRAAKADKKDAEERIKRCEGIFGGFMGECDTLMRGSEKLLTWKTIDRSGYEVKPTSYREFRLAKGSAA